MKRLKVLVSAIVPALTAACVTVEKNGLVDWQDPVTWRIGASTGGSGVWLLANFAYAGMRAQGNQCIPGWRVLAFIFGLPGTLLSWFVIVEGSERAYGVDLPRRSPQPPAVQDIYPGQQKSA